VDMLSDSAIVKVISDPDWNGTGDFIVEYELTLPGRVVRAGNRRLMPLAMFVAGTNNAFKRAERKSPIYFWYPYVSEEDVRIDLPAGWKVAELPDGEALDLKRATYTIEALRMVGANEAVRVKRKLRMNMMMLPADTYEPIQKFFQSIRAGDGQQVVVSGDAK